MTTLNRNPQRLDPSRTGLIRRAFMGAVNKRLNRLKKRLWDLVAIEDAFGLTERKPFTFNAGDDCGAGSPGNPGFQPGNTCGGSRADLAARFPKVKGSHDLVDGRRVSKTVDNTSSIAASLTNYEIMPGIRRVKTSDFHGWKNPYSETRVDEIRKTQNLVERIRESKRISPLIVVIDREGPYILEGGHRYDALKILGATELPAMVVIDRDSLPIKPTQNSDCGAGEPGSPGFQPGNICAADTGGGRSYSDARKLSFKDIKDNPKLLDEPEVAKVFVKTVAMHWNSTEVIPAKIRSLMKRLLPHTVGGSLAEYHPGAVTMYRGRSKSKASTGVRGWSTSKKVAAGFGKSLETKTITRDTPALDLTKVLGASEDEVVTENELVVNTRWKFLTFPEQLEQFKLWLARHIIVDLLPSDAGDSWLETYIRQAYSKGMERVYDYLKKPEYDKPAGFYEGSKREFLRSAFGRPVAVNRVKLLAGRSLSDLKGVSEAMSTNIVRELTDGMIKGQSPREVARNISDQVEKIGRKRALMIARTETIRAHAEGQLDSMEAMGVHGVTARVEWSTSKMGFTKLGNPSPCKLCAPLEGIVLTPQEAHGMIPRHPNCMCSWIPAGVLEDKGQIKTRKRIVEAIKKSVGAERGKNRKKRTLRQQRKLSRWVGAGAKISKVRPKSILED